MRRKRPRSEAQPVRQARCYGGASGEFPALAGIHYARWCLAIWGRKGAGCSIVRSYVRAQYLDSDPVGKEDMDQGDFLDTYVSSGLCL